MVDAADKKHQRLRYPHDREGAAAAQTLPNDELRGHPIPNKLADPRTRGILLGAAAFTSVENAASMAGVAAKSVYELRKRDPEFEEQWQTARARMCVSLEMSMHVVGGDPKNPRCVEAAKLILQANKPEVYRQRHELEVTAPVGTVEIVKAAAAMIRERRRLGTPVAEIVEEPSGNGHGDVMAIVKAAGGNGNGSSDS
ncbi:MAG TPA: hypothetical protein VF316_22460 [Polyangiaceae bacterium]